MEVLPLSRLKYNLCNISTIKEWISFRRLIVSTLFSVSLTLSEALFLISQSCSDNFFYKSQIKLVSGITTLNNLQILWANSLFHKVRFHQDIIIPNYVLWGVHSCILSLHLWSKSSICLWLEYLCFLICVLVLYLIPKFK